jgi:hypothetical protein
MKKSRQQVLMDYRRNNKDKIKQSSDKYRSKPETKLKIRERYLKNRDKVFEQQKLKPKFGMTLEEYKELWRFQNGLCLICRKPESKPGVKWLSVDHNHRTGLIRGLLCGGCNVALGNFKEDVRAILNAAWYIHWFNGE